MTPQRWLWREGLSRWQGETKIRGAPGPGRLGTPPHSRQRALHSPASHSSGANTSRYRKKEGEPGGGSRRPAHPRNWSMSCGVHSARTLLKTVKARMQCLKYCMRYHCSDRSQFIFYSPIRCPNCDTKLQVLRGFATVGATSSCTNCGTEAALRGSAVRRGGGGHLVFRIADPMGATCFAKGGQLPGNEARPASAVDIGRQTQRHATHAPACR